MSQPFNYRSVAKQVLETEVTRNLTQLDQYFNDDFCKTLRLNPYCNKGKSGCVIDVDGNPAISAAKSQQR